MKTRSGRTCATLLATVCAAVAGALATAGGAAAQTVGQSVTYSYDESAAVAQANAPLRIVLVGFTKGQVDEQALVSQIPAAQRPGVLIPYDEDTADSPDQCGVFLGLNTLLDHGR